MVTSLPSRVPPTSPPTYYQFDLGWLCCRTATTRLTIAPAKSCPYQGPTAALSLRGRMRYSAHGPHPFSYLPGASSALLAYCDYCGLDPLRCCWGCRPPVIHDLARNAVPIHGVSTPACCVRLGWNRLWSLACRPNRVRTPGQNTWFGPSKRASRIASREFPGAPDM